MRKTLFVFFLVSLMVVFMVGCGGQSSSISPAPGSTPTNPAASYVPVSLTVTDTPPTGVTVLFFQLSITGATLAPGNVSLLPGSNSIPVNVTQLQTDSAFLGSANVAAGNYASLSLTFANPELTIFNGTGAAIGTCAANTVCQLTPTAQSLTLTFNTAPFPVDLTAASPLAFVLDIHLDTVIQSDLSVNLGVTNGVTLSQLPAPPTGQPVAALGHVLGTIQSINSATSPNSFVLATGDGRTFTIDVNGSTVYDYPNSVCAADAFSCLATQQVVKAEVSIETGGTLLATEVDYVQPAGQTVVEGSILRLSTASGNTVIDLILQGGPPAPNSTPFNFGQRVTVTVPPTGVSYAVDHGTFTLPSGLTFTSASDLLVGQNVTVAVVGMPTTSSNSNGSTPWGGKGSVSFTTNSITLEPSQFTGPVSAVDASALSFTLDTLPVFFAPASPNATSPSWNPSGITVQTMAATTFDNLTPESVAGISVPSVVSVDGWLFPTPGATPALCTVNMGCLPNTTLAADKVKGRPGPSALF